MLVALLGGTVGLVMPSDCPDLTIGSKAYFHILNLCQRVKTPIMLGAWLAVPDGASANDGWGCCSTNMSPSKSDMSGGRESRGTTLMLSANAMGLTYRRQ